MAISASHLTHGNGGESPTTASISPGANRLILVTISAYKGSGSWTGSEASASGNGITYAQVTSTADFTAGAGVKRQWLFRGMSASPSSGAISITVTGAGFTEWSVDEVDGVDTGGSNGSAAIVQSNINSATGTSLTVTLSAFASGSNGAFGCVRNWAGSTAFTPEGGWTELYDGGAVDEPQTQWRSDNDTTCSWTFSSDTVAGIAIEIAAAGGGGGGSTNNLAWITA